MCSNSFICTQLNIILVVIFQTVILIFIGVSWNPIFWLPYLKFLWLERKQRILGSKNGYIIQWKIQWVSILWSNVNPPHWWNKQRREKENRIIYYNACSLPYLKLLWLERKQGILGRKNGYLIKGKFSEYLFSDQVSSHQIDGMNKRERERERENRIIYYNACFLPYLKLLWLERKQGIVGSKNGYINQWKIQWVSILWSSVKPQHWWNEQRRETDRQTDRKKEAKQSVCEWISWNFFCLLLNYKKHFEERIGASVKNILLTFNNSLLNRACVGSPALSQVLQDILGRLCFSSTRFPAHNDRLALF